MMFFSHALMKYHYYLHKYQTKKMHEMQFYTFLHSSEVMFFTCFSLETQV